MVLIFMIFIYLASFNFFRKPCPTKKLLPSKSIYTYTSACYKVKHEALHSTCKKCLYKYFTNTIISKHPLEKYTVKKNRYCRESFHK